MEDDAVKIGYNLVNGDWGCSGSLSAWFCDYFEGSDTRKSAR